MSGEAAPSVREAVARQWSGTEDLILRVDDPHHRAILENYRMHSMLELCERFDEILAPDLTVAEPVYWISTPEGRTVYEGHDAVRDLFYGAMASAGGTFLTKEHERIAVADWGFSQEQFVHYHMSAEAASRRGYDIDDWEAVYVEDRWTSMQWHYTADAKLIGEHVYRAPISSFRKVPPTEFLTVAQVREVLDPVIARGNFRQD